MEEGLLYDSEYYYVVVHRDRKEEEQYIIVNKLTNVIDGFDRSMPGALATAEQMDRILRFEYWKQFAQHNYPGKDEFLGGIIDDVGRGKDESTH